MVEVSTSRAADTLRVTVKARTHEITSDVLTEDGGTDLGPTPHELLAASLAACTSITVQMYANRKGWPLKTCNVTVRMPEGQKDKTDETEQTKFDATVSFNGDLTPEQRARLLEIAKRCPVHRALSRPIEIHVIAV